MYKRSCYQTRRFHFNCIKGTKYTGNYLFIHSYILNSSTNLLARSNGSIDMGMFKQKVAAYCFTENAFPNPEEARVACNRIIREITDLNDDQRDRQTDGALLTKVKKNSGIDLKYNLHSYWSSHRFSC